MCHIAEFGRVPLPWLQGNVGSLVWRYVYDCLPCAQYVGTVLNKALGHGLREEVLQDDPAVLNWRNGNGFKAEDVTTELILRGRNSYRMSSEHPDNVLSAQGKLCHATERCAGPSKDMLFKMLRSRARCSDVSQKRR